MGKKWKQWQILSYWAPKITGQWLQPWNYKMLAPCKKSYNKPTQCLKKLRYHFANKGPKSQSYRFSSSYIRMCELDHKEGWAPKNWCFWTMVLEKALQSSLDSKEIKSVNPKGNQPRIFIGRTDAEAPILWPLDVKSQLTGKDPWCWERLRAGGEGENKGWHGWMALSTQWTWVWATPRTVKDREVWHAAVHGVTKVRHDLATEQTLVTELTFWYISPNKKIQKILTNAEFKRQMYGINFFLQFLWISKMFNTIG